MELRQRSRSLNHLLTTIDSFMLTIPHSSKALPTLFQKKNKNKKQAIDYPKWGTVSDINWPHNVPQSIMYLITFFLYTC